MKVLKMTTEQRNTFIVNILSTSHQLNDIPKAYFIFMTLATQSLRVSVHAYSELSAKRYLI